MLGTPSPAELPDSPPGFLRLLAVFHESEALGAGRSLLRALPALGSYGWAATGWFPGGGPLVEEAEGLLAAHAGAEKPLRYSVRGWRSGPGVAARLRDTPAYLRSFRQALLRARPHVVHANTLRTLPEASVARSLGLPVVVHVHELPEPGRKSAAALRWAASVADVLVAVSEAVADVVRPHARRTPLLVAYNGVAAARRARGPEPASPIVGSLGTVCRTKGTDVFLEAAALAGGRAPELRFEHVGQFGLDEDVVFAEQVQARAASPDLCGRLELLGRRPAAEALARWELLVLASRRDAFPLATLEAMAAGVPVLATAVGGLPEQVVHLETGVLVPPERPDALADWIVRLHGDAELRQRLARAAAERVAERFTLERQAAVLHEAYLAALNLRHGPPQVRRRTREAA